MIVVDVVDTATCNGARRGPMAAVQAHGVR